jgi:propionyl-CoA carboxylase beta chain
VLLSPTARALAEYHTRIERAITSGEERARKRQEPKGKATARQRIDSLLDPGSFVETGALVRHQTTAFGLDANRPEGDGVITGHGTVDGRPVCLFSQDFSVLGGSLGEAHGRKIAQIHDLAIRIGAPIVGIWDGGGARIQEGVASLAQFAEIFRRNVEASGIVPQIALILGPSAGGAVYSPAMTDFIVMADGTSQMFITGPDVIKAVTGEEIGFEKLGGGHTHAVVSGVAHHLAATEEEAIEYVKTLLTYLPSNNLSDPPVVEPTFPEHATPAQLDSLGRPAVLRDAEAALDVLVPDSDSVPYNMACVIEAIVDDAEFCEIQPLFAPTIVVGFARIEGHAVGLVANQPNASAGVLDINSSAKAARFVRTCDAFGLPIITLVDTPGFLPGVDQEWGGIIRHGAKLLYAYAEATTPLVTVITRKAYGGAYIVMGSKMLCADVALAWPTAQIAVMGAEGAVRILHRRALKDLPPDQAKAEETRLADEYTSALIGPYVAAERGYVDAVIQPSATRAQIAVALRALRTKRATRAPRKHGNIPL